MSGPGEASDRAAVRFKRSVAVLVGTLALVVSVLHLVQSDVSRRAGDASATATIDSITAFAQLSAGGSRDQFERDTARRVTLLTQAAISRATASVPGSDALTPNTSLAVVDARSAARLARIRQRLVQLPAAPAGVDAPMREALSTVDPDHVDPLLNAAFAATATASTYGNRGSKLSAAIALLAIAAALLGLAALMGPDRGGLIARNTATVAMVAAVAWAATGFV